MHGERPQKVNEIMNMAARRYLLWIQFLGRDVEELAGKLGVLVELPVLVEQESTLESKNQISNEHGVCRLGSSNVRVSLLRPSCPKSITDEMESTVRLY